MYKMYKSQFGQDEWLNNNIFHNKKGGFFIDIGAHDGVTISNTYFFEKELGWKGICVEPNPIIFQQLCQNRKSECIHGCAYNRDGVVRFQWLDGYTEMLSGICETYNERHNDRIAREIAMCGGNRKIIDVFCYKLADILSERNISHVDYISIDTEGSELQVLEGIDFDKVTFGVINVEVNYPEEDKWKMEQFLNSKNYKLCTSLGGDDIYIPKTD
jgi:FkbM family methyltransferase